MTPDHGRVFLFSGHMVDRPDRKVPRFPPGMVPAAAVRIGAALDALGARAGDLALSQAAAGGDLLFLEACQQRGVTCRVYLPFPIPEFIARSVLPSVDGEAWRQRFESVQRQLTEPVHIMTEELGATPVGTDPFERCNLWLLDSALALGPEMVQCICLWNGGGGDGPGGTAHMVREVGRRGGHVTHIDTRTL